MLTETKKRKESEPYIEVSGLEDEKSQPAPEEEAVAAKKWMKSMMKELKERTDDVSEFERSMDNCTTRNERSQSQYEQSSRGALQNI